MYLNHQISVWKSFSVFTLMIHIQGTLLLIERGNWFCHNTSAQDRNIIIIIIIIIENKKDTRGNMFIIQ